MMTYSENYIKYFIFVSLLPYFWKNEVNEILDGEIANILCPLKHINNKISKVYRWPKFCVSPVTLWKTQVFHPVIKAIVKVNFEKDTLLIMS